MLIAGVPVPINSNTQKGVSACLFIVKFGRTITTNLYLKVGISHHIDGNHENNHPDNLMCVSPYVHWCIHLLQGDPVAESGKFISNAGKAGKLGGAKNLGK